MILVCLCPPVLGWLTDRGLRVLRLPPLERRVTWRGLAVATGWTALGWLLLGMQVWLLLASMTGRGAGVLLVAVGGYALACSVALALVVFPNGIGARELILIAALAPVLDRPAALALALLARAATTISDLAWGGIGLAIGRRVRVQQAASSAASAHQPRRPARRHSAADRSNLTPGGRRDRAGPQTASRWRRRRRRRRRFRAAGSSPGGTCCSSPGATSPARARAGRKCWWTGWPRG